MYICQLSQKEQFELYKQIKNTLIQEDAFTFENLSNAMNSKVSDIDGLLNI